MSIHHPLHPGSQRTDEPTPLEQREFLSLMMARVADAFVRPPFYVDAALDLVSVCRLLAQAGQTNALVRDGPRLGMFTTTDLRDALLLATPPAELPVRDAAHFDLITVHPHDRLFEALLLMIRHRVHRVLVRDSDRVHGVLSQLDLMSFVANHSHIIALQIEQARSVEQLRTASLQMDRLVTMLHSSGVRVDAVAALVRELNSQLMRRLWALLAPAELIANSCLVVMGSEGRGEQILKTDQDNALLLRDGFECASLESVVAEFSAALSRLGFPPCPGGIMVTNPLWRQPLANFKATLREWLLGADPQGPMNLAIFLDGAAVAGDAAVLQAARQFVDEVLVDNDAFLARFAAAADQFPDPAGWWTRWTALRRNGETPLDLKKIGTFPIVHGVRALALQYRIAALATTQRLAALSERGLLDAELARDLVDSLHFLMGLKLKHQLEQRESGVDADNLIVLSQLGTLERDTLKDSLAIVKRFRQVAHQHFKLDAL